MDSIDITFIGNLVKEKKSHEEISNILKEAFPREKGFSVRSVRIFCKENEITSKVKEDDLNVMVKQGIESVSFLVQLILYLNAFTRKKDVMQGYTYVFIRTSKIFEALGCS